MGGGESHNKSGGSEKIPKINKQGRMYIRHLRVGNSASAVDAQQVLKSTFNALSFKAILIMLILADIRAS